VNCRHVAYVTGNVDPVFIYGIRCRKCNCFFDAAIQRVDAVILANAIN
jgi:hypothetical protein